MDVQGVGVGGRDRLDLGGGSPCGVQVRPDRGRGGRCARTPHCGEMSSTALWDTHPPADPHLISLSSGQWVCRGSIRPERLQPGSHPKQGQGRSGVWCCVWRCVSQQLRGRRALCTEGHAGRSQLRRLRAMTRLPPHCPTPEDLPFLPRHTFLKASVFFSLVQQCS